MLVTLFGITRLPVKPEQPRTCLPLIGKFDIHGMVHITGGGFYDNIPRALPDDMGVEIDAGFWTVLQAVVAVDFRAM